jgi:hypothetical protein
MRKVSTHFLDARMGRAARPCKFPQLPSLLAARASGPCHTQQNSAAHDRFPLCPAPVQVRAISPNKIKRRNTMKNIITNRFGLVALMMLSLFASTASFAANAASTPVIVTNTPAQPVPVVGLVTDADNPARQPFQWFGSFGLPAASGGTPFKVTTADGSHRLVITDVSGNCFGGINNLALMTPILNGTVFQYHFLPVALWKTGGGSTPVLFYVDPGHDLYFSLNTAGTPAGNCELSVSGYYVFAQTLAQ